MIWGRGHLGRKGVDVVALSPVPARFSHHLFTARLLVAPISWSLEQTMFKGAKENEILIQDLPEIAVINQFGIFS